ncbi:hypothetical protein SCLCIDRAFT_10800 [Scleroderma citrinum Foug A]|uniref:Uncharacterized protein n=1 Tax=Scleroderma citrinum Foug A TaxID=1036808 RepID=A0A0C2ZUE5_9AGAM|nr:hypothetical protein SCLCIDRAFT_10800 [Scleroderma citrinum Foug A]
MIGLITFDNGLSLAEWTGSVARCLGIGHLRSASWPDIQIDPTRAENQASSSVIGIDCESIDCQGIRKSWIEGWECVRTPIILAIEFLKSTSWPDIQIDLTVLFQKSIPMFLQPRFNVYPHRER